MCMGYSVKMQTGMCLVGTSQYLVLRWLISGAWCIMFVNSEEMCVIQQWVHWWLISGAQCIMFVNCEEMCVIQQWVLCWLISNASCIMFVNCEEMCVNFCCQVFFFAKPSHTVRTMESVCKTIAHIYLCGFRL